jgi:anti-sigma factor RsiW
MTETLRTAIERLLSPDGPQLVDTQPSNSTSDVLRARLAADFSDALAGNLDYPDTAADNARLLNGIAAYLDGRLEGDEREQLIAAIAQAPQRRAMLESAAAFLEDLKLDDAELGSKSIPQDLLAEATAVFAPTQSHRQAVAAMAPAQRSNRRRLPVWAGMAAVLALVAVGSAKLTLVGQGPPDLMRAEEAAEKDKAPTALAPSILGTQTETANDSAHPIAISAPTPIAPTILRSEAPPANPTTFDLLGSLPSANAYSNCNADQPERTYQITRDLHAALDKTGEDAKLGNTPCDSRVTNARPVEATAPSAQILVPHASSPPLTSADSSMSGAFGSVPSSAVGHQSAFGAFRRSRASSRNQ